MHEVGEEVRWPEVGDSSLILCPVFFAPAGGWPVPNFPARPSFRACWRSNISINDLPGLRLYVAAAVIESPGEWLPLIIILDPR